MSSLPLLPANSYPFFLIHLLSFTQENLWGKLLVCIENHHTNHQSWTGDKINLIENGRYVFNDADISRIFNFVLLNAISEFKILGNISKMYEKLYNQLYQSFKMYN